jgi:hypothetical protein
MSLCDPGDWDAAHDTKAFDFRSIVYSKVTRISLQHKKNGIQPLKWISKMSRVAYHGLARSSNMTMQYKFSSLHELFLQYTTSLSLRTKISWSTSDECSKSPRLTMSWCVPRALRCSINSPCALACFSHETITSCLCDQNKVPDLLLGFQKT